MASNDNEEPSKAEENVWNWLHGHNTTPSFTFFTSSPPFSLKDLHAVLHRAVREISLKLDPQLECFFGAAREEQHSIMLEELEFMETRVLAVEELMEMGRGIESLNRERVVQLLEMCRDEIEWERQEIRRLDVHCDIAREQKQHKLRESFQYRPLPRKEREVVPGVGVVSFEDRRDSARDQPVVKKEEEEDESVKSEDEYEDHLIKKEDEERGELVKSEEDDKDEEMLDADESDDEEANMDLSA